MAARRYGEMGRVGAMPMEMSDHRITLGFVRDIVWLDPVDEDMRREFSGTLGTSVIWLTTGFVCGAILMALFGVPGWFVLGYVLPCFMIALWSILFMLILAVMPNNIREWAGNT